MVMILLTTKRRPTAAETEQLGNQKGLSAHLVGVPGKFALKLQWAIDGVVGPENRSLLILLQIIG